jgi:drug/metabolite transporter (DMT)-like permease
MGITRPVVERPMEGRDGFFPYAAAAACGFVVNMGISMATGRHDPMDHGSYYTIGQPLMCVGALAIGYLFPRRPWRWALAMAAGQMIAALLNGNSLNLLPFAIAYMTILSVPQVIAAYAGAWLSRRRSRA